MRCYQYLELATWLQVYSRLIQGLCFRYIRSGALSRFFPEFASFSFIFTFSAEILRSSPDNNQRTRAGTELRGYDGFLPKELRCFELKSFIFLRDFHNILSGLREIPDNCRGSVNLPNISRNSSVVSAYAFGKIPLEI